MVVNCEQVWKEISNYIDGEVDGDLRTAMDEHLRTCKRCTSVLQGARNVVQLYGDERMIEAPAGFGRRLERRLTQESRVRRWAWPKWSVWLVPVAALALIVGGLRWTRSVGTPRPIQSERAKPTYNIPPDMMVVVALNSKEFHVAECDLVRNQDKVQTMTAKEAIQAGYTPCPKCMRKYVQTANNGIAHPEQERDASGL